MDKNLKNVKTEILHNLIMENRAKLSVSGVEDVESFNEEEIVLHTQMETLVVTGEDLKINKLSVDTGEVAIEGAINCLKYVTTSRDKGSFLSRIFK